jgi:hypothetical protein
MPFKPEKATEAELVAALKTNASEVNARATELSERISAFEEWLNELPGKVPANCWVDNDEDDSGQTEFGLRYARQGKWQLFYTYCRCDQHEYADWNQLCDAGIEIKMEAVGAFPFLLKAIYDAQLARVKNLESTSKYFDEFAAKIGLDRKGTKDEPF